MLISYSHNFLFVHIAKTGGTSVRTALRPYRWSRKYAPALMLASLLSQSTRPRHILGVKFPRHAKAVAAQEMLPAPFYRDLFKFVFVRNPWDLQVSAYHHMQRSDSPVMEGIRSFDDFLRMKLDPERPYHYMLDISSEDQWQYLVDLNGDIIVDFIGRYESLQEDFRHVCERVGVECPELPHKRHSKDRQDYRQYYSEETAEMVARRYRKDIELLKYRF